MLSGLMGMREGEQLLPFAKLFYGDPSTYLWEDGDVHHIHQGEGGEQGDALMPMLFCLGQQRSVAGNRGATVACMWCANLTESATCTLLLGKNSGDTQK